MPAMAVSEASHCLARDCVSTLQTDRPLPIRQDEGPHMKDKICLMFTALRSSGQAAR